MEIEIIERGKGNILLFESYEYVKHSQLNNGDYLWRCSKRHKTKCKVYLTVSPVSTH